MLDQTSKMEQLTNSSHFSVKAQTSVETLSSVADKESQERKNIVKNVVDKVHKERGRPRKKKLENNLEFY
uniref:Ovule protein n=1 Tax=Strongyloides venezuelensis TaxID=75913 RepID=A0A0K0EZN8_STRVS